MKKILFYTPNQQKYESVLSLCRDMQISLKRLDYKDLTRSVTDLFNAKANSSGATLPPLYISPEVMVICGLSDKDLDVFLAKYKEAKIEPVKLKAIMTPFNFKMSIYELTQELIKEAASIK